jgi:hypothetical protein
MDIRSFLAETLHPNFNSMDTVPSRDWQGSLVSIQSGWMWSVNTGYKGYTSPFYENPKGWTRPQGTGKTLISTIENNGQSFNWLQLKLQLFQTHLSPTCKSKQCNPLRKSLEYNMRTINISYIWVGSRDRLLRCLWVHLTPNPSEVTVLPPLQYYLHVSMTIELRWP